MTGFGKVDGRLVWAVSQDFTVMGGSMGQHHCRKINRASEEAARNGCPCVYFWDGGFRRPGLMNCINVQFLPLKIPVISLRYR